MNRRWLLCLLFVLMGAMACAKEDPGTTPQQPDHVPLGTLLWSFPSDDSISATPLLAEGTLFSANWGGQVTALDPSNGKPKWQSQGVIGGMISQAPSVAKETLFVASQNNSLHALNTADGSVRWKFESSYWNFATPLPDPATGTVYLTSNDAHLYAIDMSTGKEKWKYKADSGIRGSAVMGGDVVFVGDVLGVLHAVGKDGKLRWRYKVTGHALESLETRVSKEKLETISQGWIVGAPLYDKGVVYFVVAHSLIGSVYAMDASTGALKWKIHVSEQIESTPALHNGQLYVGSNDHHLYALDAATGEERWKFRTDNQVLSTPSFSGERVYITSADGHLYALREDSGLLLWKYKAPDTIHSSPVFSAGVIYFGCMDEKVYAVKEPTLNP